MSHICCWFFGLVWNHCHSKHKLPIRAGDCCYKKARSIKQSSTGDCVYVHISLVLIILVWGLNYEHQCTQLSKYLDFWCNHHFILFRRNFILLMFLFISLPTMIRFLYSWWIKLYFFYLLMSLLSLMHLFDFWCMV